MAKPTAVKIASRLVTPENRLACSTNIHAVADAPQNPKM
jgi:hypothetical protein